MKFQLIIDKTTDEEVIARVHKRSALTDKLEQLVLQGNKQDTVPAYTEDEMVLLRFADMECITILDGKTYAIDTKGVRYRLKQRLYELEKIIPPEFIKINKSSLANEKRLERFAATYSGGINAVFKCGYTDYVSRRCFANIKRRFETK